MSKKPHLTAKQANAVQAYINEIRDLMGLRHWDIYVSTKRAPKGALASIHPTDGRALAPLSLSKGWMGRPAEDQRLDIVHELIHVIHRDQTDLVRLSTLDVLDRPAYLVLISAHRSATEVMVDHLATIIAPTMPLPDFTTAQEDA